MGDMLTREINHTGRGALLRRMTMLGLAALMALALCGLRVAPASAATTPPPGDPPPVCGAYYPGDCLIQTRNGGFHLSPRIVRAGGELTGTVTNRCVVGDGNNDPCPISWAGMTALGKVVSGCKDGTTCTVKIPKSATSGDYGVVNVAITNVQGAGYSSDYYAVVGRHDAVVEGQVTNKDKAGAPGVTVDIYGAGGSYYTAVTGQDGHYSADVKAGHYHVFPEAGSVSSRGRITFSPTASDVHAPPNGTATADFELDSGLLVTLKLSKSSVPANGQEVVNATVHVSQYGEPVSGQTVELWPQSDETSHLAVTSGPRVLMCTAGGRIWPTGSLTDPDGLSVDETTDADGNYTFSLDAGTVPGRWRLTAWAKDAAGALITTDTRDTSDDQTLTVAPLGAKVAGVDDFVPEFNTLVRATGAAAGITGDVPTLLTDLIKLTDTQTALNGLAYAPVNGSTAALLIYPASSTPHLAESGQVTPHTGDLVLEPANWTAPPGGKILTLDDALQQGQLQELPTYLQWSMGTSIPAWTGHPETMSVPSAAFQYFGWPYPSTATGSCS